MPEGYKGEENDLGASAFSESTQEVADTLPMAFQEPGFSSPEDSADMESIRESIPDPFGDVAPETVQDELDRDPQLAASLLPKQD